ncbi:MAG: hypothetical protein AB7P08_17340 [Burkholderiales bacterium]
MAPIYFDPKDPEEIITLTFDFKAALALETISPPPVVSVSVVAGVDASPGALLNGAPQLDVDSKMVMQSVKAGLDGVDYLVRCKAPTTGGQVFVLARTLPVRIAR